MISTVNNFERENIIERRREGIVIAKAEGKYKGQKEVSIPDFDKHCRRGINIEVSKAQLAMELGVSRLMLDKLIEEHLNVTI